MEEIWYWVETKGRGDKGNDINGIPECQFELRFGVKGVGGGGGGGNCLGASVENHRGGSVLVGGRSRIKRRYQRGWNTLDRVHNMYT